MAPAPPERCFPSPEPSSQDSASLVRSTCGRGPLPLQRIEIKAAAWAHPDGWLEVHLETRDVPATHLHPTTLPRLRLQIDGGRAHHLDPHGTLREEPIHGA